MAIIFVKLLEKVINFFITPGILVILENVEEKSPDILLDRDRKLYSCISMKHTFPGNTEMFKDISTP